MVPHPKCCNVSKKTKFPLGGDRILNLPTGTPCQMGWALLVPAAVPWDGAEGQEPLFGAAIGTQGHHVPCATHLGLEPFCHTRL